MKKMVNLTFLTISKYNTIFINILSGAQKGTRPVLNKYKLNIHTSQPGRPELVQLRL